MAQAVAICLAIMMVLDFLVMYFIDRVMKTPGLMIVLTVLGSVLVFVQAGLAIQMILNALKNLGVIQVGDCRSELKRQGLPVLDGRTPAR